MAVLMDTELNRDVDKLLFDAFLYGQVTSGYKLYTSCETGMLAINFECSEDAVMFKLKTLDKVFNELFVRKHSIKPSSNIPDLLLKYQRY